MVVADELIGSCEAQVIQYSPFMAYFVIRRIDLTTPSAYAVNFSVFNSWRAAR